MTNHSFTDKRMERKLTVYLRKGGYLNYVAVVLNNTVHYPPAILAEGSLYLRDRLYASEDAKPNTYTEVVAYKVKMTDEFKGYKSPQEL